MDIIRNPYFDEFALNKHHHYYLRSTIRTSLVTKYSWAIPDQEAILEIAKHGPFVEGGAGTGYWASLIHQAGADIICYDIAPPGESHNFYMHKNTYHRVHLGGAEMMSKHQDRTLLLCWAPYNSDMGYDHIVNHNGKKLILIGEDEGGCTGNDKMFSYIRENFLSVKKIFIPKWEGIRDYINILVRI